MKHLKLYEDFSEPKELTTKEEVKEWLDDYGVENYIINDDLTVDVDGEVHLWNMGLTSIPVKFKSVKGHFDCSNNNLTNLDGLKNLTSVKGHFDCSNNNLTNLDGLKNLTSVKGIFNCSNNNLENLDGLKNLTSVIHFYCFSNNLENLDGLKNLTSVEGNFDCQNNNLTNLDGLKNLTSVREDFNCFNNFLTKKYFDFDLDENNPGYEEESKPKIAKNFIEKLILDKYKEHRDRILDSIKVDDPEIYNILKSNYNLDSFLERHNKFGGQEEIDL